MDVFDILTIIVAAPIWVMCFLRAARFDKRVRPSVVATFLLLGMSAFGLSLSVLLPTWLSQACILGILASMALILVEGERRWHGGPPNELLKHHEQYPRKERREHERRGNWPEPFVSQ